jgi:hypothetical protein
MEDRTGLPTEGRLRKHLSADALIVALHRCSEATKVPDKGMPSISLHDALMSGFAMMTLKDPSLLAFDLRRTTEEHNLRSVYHMKDIPCGTRMRARLDEVNPGWLRPCQYD